MIIDDGNFLKTGLSQISTTNILISQLKSPLELFTYNIKRYKVPVTLVLFYTEEDISLEIKKNIRISDGLKVIKVGDSYFNFIFLPFTDIENSYSFVKDIEYDILNNIEYSFYLDELEHEIDRCYNFINSFLFKILERKKDTSISY
ncbi:hypothetical protein HUE87_04560 [Candidatus Sulfurimonas marisnigri]|uniref:Uncharacterized protein n=1 Tax=Candidatus Sulfurimonas marisnigri TaxID=2740405 RepID=A0A7S7RR90_9BACT|nr:hypothetical protein [Candidatus Sulfurimonas marisnigri]QOY55511.1 hypothetical protein HUE87_04560 [Candidatus Sulfurimonas marisnigri]